MDTPEKQPFSKRLQARLAASRYATFSVLLHVVIVVMGGSVVLFKRITEPPDFTAGGGDGLVTQEVQAQPPPPSEQQVEQFTPATPEVNAPEVSAIVSNTQTATPFQMPSSVPVVKAMAVTPTQDVAKLLTKTVGHGAGNLPGTMAGRAGGTARGMAMQKMGGKEKSEKAVMAGLRWLKDHQNEDGSWSDEFKPAMTGLALLCFLGHGELDVSPEFGPTVKKAVDWLITRGSEFNGRMSLTKDGWGGNPGVYQQGMCAYALGEYYTMTQDDRVKTVLTQAVKFITDGQNSNGGWKYNYEKGGPSDTSVTGWQVQALKAAHLTGLQLAGVDEALDKSMGYFKIAQKEDGSFGYHDKEEGNGYSLAGVGTLCTYFWKQDKDKLVHEGIKCIIDKTKKDFPVEYKSDKADLYAWYYNGQACLMFGGEAWVRWNRWFQDEICDNQSTDGSWPPLPGRNQGNHSPGGELQFKGNGAGPYYRTTLCVLMLEVYYRYMPTNK